MRLDDGGVWHRDAPEVVRLNARYLGGTSRQAEDDMADVRWHRRTATLEVAPCTKREHDGRHPGRLTNRRPGSCNGVVAGQGHGDGHG